MRRFAQFVFTISLLGMLGPAVAADPSARPGMGATVYQDADGWGTTDAHLADGRHGGFMVVDLDPHLSTWERCLVEQAQMPLLPEDWRNLIHVVPRACWTKGMMCQGAW